MVGTKSRTAVRSRGSAQGLSVCGAAGCDGRTVRGPLCVHELKAALEASGCGVSQPLLSQHLKVLREAGLVTTTRRRTEITYQLADAHVGHIVNDAIRHSQEGQHDEYARRALRSQPCSW